MATCFYGPYAHEAVMQSYVYEAYPKVLYAWADNPTGWISVVVANEEEEGELNETWVPNPGAVTPPAP